MKICVIGTGYVGLTTGVVFASLGNDVICVDKDVAKIEQLQKGVPTIYEPGIEELIRQGMSEEFLKFDTDLEGSVRASEIVFIAVGTPPAEDGTPDLTAVCDVAQQIGRSIDKYTIVVNKSTVPVGSGDLVERIIAEQGVARELYDVVSNPEFLREGTAIRDSLRPDRIVIGSKRREAASKLVELYATFEAPMIVTDLSSAELIKYASNSFLAMKISFINAISRICEKCGADVGDVARGIGSDSRIGSQFLSAGLGWGGSCFPKDVLGLVTTADRLNYDFRLLRAVIEINDDQTRHFMERIEEVMGGLAGKTIAVLGLAFKPDTDDIRDARSLVILDYFLSRGASIRAYDPAAMDHVRELYPQITYCEGSYQVAQGADALVLITEWNEFRNLDLVRLCNSMKGKMLFDGRRVYKQAAAERAGFEYYTIGKAGVKNPALV